LKNDSEVDANRRVCVEKQALVPANFELTVSGEAKFPMRRATRRCDVAKQYLDARSAQETPHLGERHTLAISAMQQARPLPLQYEWEPRFDFE
jgi:hypothetical protein